METQLYFWKPLVEIHKKQLSSVEDYYVRTRVQFDDIEKEADEHAKSFFNDYPATELTDPGTVAEWATEQGIEMYDVLSTMKKNHLLMTVSMLYHIWEQQLINFTYDELRHDLKFDRKSLSYRKAQRIFELHRIRIAEMGSWGKIRELKCLANTIKHGDGDSAQKLRTVRPDFFELDFISGTDTLELAGAVLLDGFSLQVKESDLHDYVEAAKSFWDEMPERAYADMDAVIQALSEKQ